MALAAVHGPEIELLLLRLTTVTSWTMKIFLLKVSGLSLIGWFLLGGRVAAMGDGVVRIGDHRVVQHDQLDPQGDDRASAQPAQPPDRGSPDRSRGTGTY
ncbi:MAG: hypothetical protein Fur0042_00490 [Cyanophyceae cyanobacterium]